MSCRCHVRSLYLLYVAERFYQVPAGRRFKISPRSLWNPSYQVSGLGAQCLQFASTSPLLFFAQTAAKIVILSLNKFVICNYLSWLFGWFFGFILFFVHASCWHLFIVLWTTFNPAAKAVKCVSCDELNNLFITLRGYFDSWFIFS